MVDANQLVKVYIKIRDAKAAKERERDEEISALEAQMDLIQAELLEICKATGQESGKTASGSFRRSIKTRYWTSDWDSMYRFVRDHNLPELLEKRLHQGNFKEFLKDNPDKLPEGINVESKYAITVTRARE